MQTEIRSSLDPLLEEEVRALIQKAFKEDFVHQDLTSCSCIPKEQIAKAHIVLKQPGRIAGLVFVPLIFQLCDPNLQVDLFGEEGQSYAAGQVLARIEGPARSILSAERTALNLLQHLCGIATLTAHCVAKVKNTHCQILDTRKTLAGMRLLQKYAVRMGGGTNHRLHLADRILIKNNHLALTPSLTECVSRAKIVSPHSWIEVEIDSKQQLEEAIQAGAQAVLLDNMTPQEIALCVEQNRKRVYLEASGGIHLGNVAEYAQTGVDGISLGALTHSAPALDLSLRIQKN